MNIQEAKDKLFELFLLDLKDYDNNLLEDDLCKLVDDMEGLFDTQNLRYTDRNGTVLFIEDWLEGVEP